MVLAGGQFKGTNGCLQCFLSHLAEEKLTARKVYFPTTTSKCRTRQLSYYKQKTKIVKVNTASTEPVLLEGSLLDKVESFTYLGSIINMQGGTDKDAKTRIGKARTVFLQLQTIWKSRELSQRTKIRIFNSIVKSVLLYGAETWRITKATVAKVQTFINSCLRRILRVHWPDKISNISLWERAQQITAEREIKRREEMEMDRTHV